MSRLPQPGSDKGTWGDILNDYLLQAHNADGTIKNGVVTSAAIAPNAVTASAIVNGSITANLLSSEVQASLANADAAATGSPDATTTTKGLVQLTGALGGTATSPTIALGAITDSNISETAAIAQSKVNGLTTALSTKADATSLSTVATSGSYADLIDKPTIPEAAPVTSVASRTGDVVLTSADVGLGNVNDTSDADKPISTATQAALDAITAGSTLDLTAGTTPPDGSVTSAFYLMGS